MVKNPSKIKNKTKRAQIYAKYKQQKSKVKKIAKEEKKKIIEELGDLAPPKQVLFFLSFFLSLSLSFFLSSSSSSSLSLFLIN